MNYIGGERISEYSIAESRMPSTFWSNTLNTQDNPKLLMAKSLEQKAVGVSVSNYAVHPSTGVRMDIYASIHATPEGKHLLNQISRTPELDALSRAYSQSTEPHVESCDWDDNTKRRVQALYWQRKADESRPWNLPRYVEEAEEKARGLLGGELKPLTVEEITKLVQEKVDRVLNTTLDRDA